MATFSQHPIGKFLTSANWKAALSLYLFFAYFSVLLQLVLFLSHSTRFIGLRQAVVMSFFWFVPVLLLHKHTKLVTAIIGVVLWAASLVSIGYFCIYQQEFSQSVIFVALESNAAESSEYISQYFVWWMVPVFALHTIVAYWLWRNIRPLKTTALVRWSVSFLILFVLLIYPIFKYTQIDKKSTDDVVEKMLTNIEPATPWQLVTGFVQYRLQLGNMERLLEENAKLPPLQNFKDAHANEPATLVLVIGESTNRGHMSLYGYSRKTTPKLDAMRDKLHIFNQVVASRPYTIEMLQQALTFGDQEHPDLHLTKPTLMNMMKQAGYKSYWITNQQTVTKRNTMLTTFSKQTDVQVYLNNTRVQDSRQYDGDVLDPFEKALQDPAPRKFIVVHLLGTHMKYVYRYPPEFDHFKDSTGLAEGFDDKQVEVINTYDNAVLYNDFVVSELMLKFEASKQNGFLTYFSDHGEDVYDSPSRNVLGRNEASPTLPMYTVPMLMWFSPEWQNVKITQDVLNRPYSTAHFIHTWADLAGLSFAEFDAEKSLVSSAFKPLPMLVGQPQKPKELKVICQQQTYENSISLASKGCN